MIERIDHVNIVVADLEMMTAFYRDVLCLKVTKEVRIHGEWIDEVVGLTDVEADVVYLDLADGPRIELIQYRSPVGGRPAGIEISNSIGLRHMAFKVDAIDELVAKLRLSGVKFFSEVRTVPTAQVQYAGGVKKRLVYFRDPEGNLLEFCEYKK
ncbi:MAG TPA: VOC family protein [Tepidisphaeraceae bacterium]|jgi:catechol 2,3-dioxygenase-like lactoylglutathione lyase family enzyme